MHVVMASGGYSRGAYRPVERAVLPIATYVMATEPLGDSCRGHPGRAAIYDTRFSFDYYRALPDTRMLWGGRISVLDRQAEPIARLLKRDMLKVYPELRDAKVDYAWGGLMSYARHSMPQIGRLPEARGTHWASAATASADHRRRRSAGRHDRGDAGARAVRALWLARTFGAAGLAAAEATYLAKVAADAVAELSGR